MAVFIFAAFFISAAALSGLAVVVTRLSRWRARVRAREAALAASKRATMRRDLQAFLLRERLAAG